MGSNIHSKRKSKDAPIIKVPAASLGSGKARLGLPELVADKCIASFEEKIEESPLVKTGVTVHLQTSGEQFSILVQGSEVGLLTKKNSSRIKDCLQLNVHYSGKIIKKKDDYYARFTRELN